MAAPSWHPTAVVVWPWSSGDAVASTLRSVLASTSRDTAVLIPGFADGRILDGLAPLRPDGLVSLACEPGAGFAEVLNEAARHSGEADLAVIADACLLPAGWLERLRAAACSDDTVAAATTLAAGAGAPLFSGHHVDPVLTGPTGDESIRASEAVIPRIFNLRPHCTYLRRSAIQLLGPFDAALTHPAAVLTELSARALGRGLSCALADDVCVERLPGGLPACPEAEIRIVARLHPWIESAHEEESALEVGPLRRALVAAHTSRRRMSVTIDARALGPAPGGTQTYVAGLVRALAESGRVSVRAVLRDAAPSGLTEELQCAGVAVVGEAQAADEPARTDIAHRPQQVFTPEDLRFLRALGERLVLTHLDLIAYRNPSYHASPEEWRRYRRVTRLALSAADQVVFFSEHARREAISEDLIEPRWTATAGVGITPAPEGGPSRRPRGVPSDRPLLVMLGADYQHKNRLFALQLVDELHRRHGWEGLLVLAGPHVAHGSSAAAEATLLGFRPELAAQVLDLGLVDEAEKRWLLDHGRAVLCPSTYEGFGLTPLEAAAAKTPCVYAATTSLAEVVGPEAATIVPWDPASSADRANGLLRFGEERDRHLQLLAASIRPYDWESVVDRLCHVYELAIASPYRSSVPRAWEELKREQFIVDLHEAYVDLKQRVDYGLPLVDRGGLLTREHQRGLMRIASRRWLRGPLLGPLGLLGGVRPDHRHRTALDRDSAAASRRDASGNDSAPSSS